MASRIGAQGPVLDLREEQRIIPGPLWACRTRARCRQQIRVLCIEWRIFQVEGNFAFDPLAKLSYRHGLSLASFRIEPVLR
jgi:hypothetical protein